MELSSRFSFLQSPALIYAQCYFVTIATILGTGILGLPVKLVYSGLVPFLVSFSIDSAMQILLVFYFTDLLQRACSAQLQLDGRGEEMVPLKELMDEDDEDSEDNLFSGEESAKGPVLNGQLVPSESFGFRSPNLHLLGEMFLPCVVRQLFDLIIVLQFLALLICYALAGSEAYAELIGISHIYVIPVFVWVLTFAVVFALQLVQPVISILTFLKGSLLLGTTFIAFYVGMSIRRPIADDWKSIGDPYLMGTVALGGTINTMPFVFEKIKYKKEQISKFRMAVVLGLTTCVVLNILWCWAVLEIVPQTIDGACTRSDRHSRNVSLYTTPGSVGCKGENSLQSAEANGEISTLPLTRILQEDYPSFGWVSILVEVFIMVSITVSYLTIGAALRHTLSGLIDSLFFRYLSGPKKNTETVCHCVSKQMIATALVLLALFGLVFGVAMANPQGFVVVLEKFASFTMNLQAGFFVYWMCLASKRGKYEHLQIPLTLPACMYALEHSICIFFNFAVGYDIYKMVVDGLQRHTPIVMMTNAPMTLTTAGLEDNVTSTLSSLLTNGSALTSTAPSIPDLFNATMSSR